MSSLAKKFGTNKELAENGVLFTYTELNFRVRIARASVSDTKLLKVREEVGGLDVLSDEKKSQLARGLEYVESEKKVYARALIKSWETYRDGEWQVGIEDIDDYESNKPLLPFNEENVLKVLNAYDSTVFFGPFFREKAEALEYYQGNKQEVIVGN